MIPEVVKKPQEELQLQDTVMVMECVLDPKLHTVVVFHDKESPQPIPLPPHDTDISPSSTSPRPNSGGRPPDPSITIYFGGGLKVKGLMSRLADTASPPVASDQEVDSSMDVEDSDPPSALPFLARFGVLPIHVMMLIMSISFLVWNCQGAADAKLHRVLKTLCAIHKLELLVLLETRISGDQADKVIRKLGFQKSHRIEARGFSGGIWVLWRPDIQVSILRSRWQFVHLKV
ncbi:hypothetical protein Scep_004804 [Stephania cephalantha]|uniref:Uncharacterized protein n=1 Tax=Stephania cephalantha TaxID=152367 RepID=A0AAP0PWY6_9MAGN